MSSPTGSRSPRRRPPRPRSSTSTRSRPRPWACSRWPGPTAATSRASGVPTRPGWQSSARTATWPAPRTCSTPWRRSRSTTATRDTARAFAVEALGVAGQRLPTVVRDAEHHAGAGGPRAGRSRRGRTPAGRGARPERPPGPDVRGRPVPASRAAAWPQPEARPTRRSACSLPRRACRRRPAAATCRRTRTSPRRWPRHGRPWASRPLARAWTLGSGLPLASARAQLADVLDRVSAAR